MAREQIARAGPAEVQRAQPGLVARHRQRLVAGLSQVDVQVTLRRFLVGPVDCEITGITEAPDGKAIFVNIQHPGEAISKANVADPAKYLSHWPGNAGYGSGGATARPRSATVVITRNDGGLIGA